MLCQNFIRYIKMKILILTIATNKYIQFVERLYDNIEDNLSFKKTVEKLMEIFNAD